MGNALEEVASAAEESAAEQRDVARRVRAIDRKRQRGWSWVRILDDEPSPGVLELVRKSARGAAAAASGLVHLVAVGLSEEGESRRRIGHRFGMSHQRISAVLNGDRRSATSASTGDE